jgi:hypothetical protein
LYLAPEFMSGIGLLEPVASLYISMLNTKIICELQCYNTAAQLS